MVPITTWRVESSALPAPGVIETTAGTVAAALCAAGWTIERLPRLDAHAWTWRAEVAAPAGDYVLCCDGIATLADIVWNDVVVATSESMYAPLRIPVVATGHDRLELRIRPLDAELAKKRPRPRWRVPMIEAAQLRWVRTTLLGRTPGWSPPTPPVGPWRPVYLERADAPHLERIAISVDAETAFVAITVAGTFESLTIEVAGRLADISKDGETWRARATVANARRWWPHTHGEPITYPVIIRAKRGSATIERVRHIGFRTITVDRDGGDFAVSVNGVRVFCRGACWTPLDVVGYAATPAAIDAAVDQLVDCGMNMLRIGGTMVYESDALYDALDRRGVLLWHDLMFANMDYPDDVAPLAEREMVELVQRLSHRPSAAVVCGNSEQQQQAAMSGATRDRWAPTLFHQTLARHATGIIATYVPSSTDGGGYPHQPRHGVSSYYGVGAYLRGLDDARRSEVRFASECLAFANIPGGELGALRAHQPAWKARSPRDLGAGWDFDDVRDHYVRALFEVDPTMLRTTDHDRYVQLGRVATGEVMARTFAEWRRGRSPTRGALVWFLRDLWAGAGWGIVDAAGAPKPCWFILRRALQPIALAITDEGCNGLAVHAINDSGVPVTGTLELALYRAGEIRVGHATRELTVGAHAAIELDPSELFEGWSDLSYAFRFGPPQVEVVHATWAGAEAFWLPSHARAREVSCGLTATVEGTELVVTSQRFAQFVAIEGTNLAPVDNYVHLAPGQTRRIALRPTGPARGTVTALDAEQGARFEVKP